MILFNRMKTDLSGNSLLQSNAQIWWAYREDKVHPEEARGVEKRKPSSPWVTEALRGTISSTTAGRGNVGSGITFDGGCKFQRGEQVWAALILQHVKLGQNRLALEMYGEMRSYGMIPGPHTFVSLLKACSSLQDLRSAREIHADVVRSGVENNLYVSSMLVNAYSKCGSLKDARQVFEDMPFRDVIVWNTLIIGYAQMEKGEDALQLFARMRQCGLVPSNRTYVGALKACSRIAECRERGGRDVVLVRKKCLETVKAIHEDIGKGKFASDEFVGNMLVDAYSKCGSLEDAREVFEKMPVHTVVSWTALISGYAQMEKGEEALLLLSQMRQEGVMPNDRTYVAALKACSTLAESVDGTGGDGMLVKKRCLVETVKGIHDNIVKEKFESDVFVANMLVDAYAKCGSLEDARQVFDKVPHCDVALWNSMILGYSQMERGQEALQLYTRMQHEGVTPNDRTYVGALKACSAIAELVDKHGGDAELVKQHSLETVRTIHAEVVKRKFDSDVYLGTMLVDAYAKCGDLETARQVFEEMPTRNVVSWSAMILGYAQMEQGEAALQLYTRMQQEGVVPNDRTYVAVLTACSSIAELEQKGGHQVLVKKQCLETVRAIHADLVKGNFGLNVFVVNTLVDAYAKSGSLDDARQVFEDMPHRNVVLWNSMILGYSQWAQGDEALKLFTRMKQEGVEPNIRTYVGALKACSTLAESGERNGGDGLLIRNQGLETLKVMHADIVNKGFEADVILGTMLIEAYAKCGSLEKARELFEKMPHRDVVSWTTLILSYSQMDRGEESLELYKRMQKEAVVPDDKAYAGALKACSAIAELGRRDVNNKTVLKTQCLETVEAIHTDMDNAKFTWNAFVGNMLVEAYAKSGSLEKSRQVFENMPHRDLVSWNIMILGYAQMEEGNEALKLYTRMQQEGFVPNHRTFVAALNACGSIAGLEKGKEIHAQILEAGLEGASFVTSSLIDMYGRCSSMVDAQRVFDAVPTTDLVVWNALVLGYARQGDSDIVFHLFSRMNQEGIHPNDITFLGVLSVCSHVGLVEIGQKYFEAMSRDYGITPTIQHYNCVVDLFGRAGQVRNAINVVKMMPFQPDIASWKCVLSACQKWGNVDIGRLAFERAVEISKGDAATYVLMSNIYEAAHLPEEAKKIQAMRVDSQAWKEPGRSWWTDLRGNSHVFVAGDQGHPESGRIYAKVGELLVKIKQGFVHHCDIQF